MAGDRIVKRHEFELEKLARTLFLCRPVLNAAEIIAHFKAQGFPKTMAPEDMHVTLAYSKAAFEWDQVGIVPNPHTVEGGSREVTPLGDGGAVVLKFEDSILAARWAGLHAAGAKSDYPSFTPHVTISWDAADVDLDKVLPWTGAIELGPEIFRELNPDWKSGVVEKSARVIKVVPKLGLVFGFAIVCTIDGQEYWDLNVDEDGERVPEHIPEDAMLRCALNFMAQAYRPGNLMHDGPALGEYPFAFPLTGDIAAALGIQTRKTGLLVGYRPPPQLLALYEDGTLTGFSIEGMRLATEEIGVPAS